MFVRTQRPLNPLNPIAWFVAVAGVSGLFIWNSYPFMFPGYDVWWHMGAIDAADHDGWKGSGKRYVWHAAWNEVLSWFPAASFFDQSLIVHRTQFMLSASLVGLSGYWVLRAVFHRTNLSRGGLLLLAWLGTLVWFVMHGTYSAAVFGGRESAAMMSWISWYSINYQIALPTALLASASLLYAVSLPLGLVRRLLMFTASGVALTITAMVHAAEVPYFLFSATLIAGLYLRGRQALWASFVLLLVGWLGVYLAMTYSYRTPELLRLLVQGDWWVLLERVDRYGQYLVDRGANRSITGWNALYTVGASALALSLLVAKRLPQQVSTRPIWFVLLTGCMPLMLLFQWSAGLLAMVTYPNLAWRFAFGSFLFLGIPVVVGMLAIALPARKKAWGISFFILALGAGLFAQTHWLDRNRVIAHFVDSLVQSVDARQMRFGLTAEEDAALDAMHTKLLSVSLDQPLCTDVFSAYYLFFLKDFRRVYLPGNVNRLPTVEHPKHTCRFPRDGGDLVALGIEPPAWRFSLGQDRSR